jgi:hypothetical protein
VRDRFEEPSALDEYRRGLVFNPETIDYPPTKPLSATVENAVLWLLVVGFFSAAAAFIVFFLYMVAFATIGHAEDLNGHWNKMDPQMHAWFESLHSKQNGACCSQADGRTVAASDWGIKDGHYWVTLDGKKLPVPDEAVVTDPNRFGQAIVWPYYYGGELTVRCFLPGAGA